MAWNDVECGSCGTTFRVQLYGKIKNRDYAVDNYDWKCDECKEKDKIKAIENAKVNQSNLPELTGSEKQVNWAIRLRENFRLSNYSFSENQDYILNNEKTSKWYIDNRDDYTSAVKNYDMPEKKLKRENKESLLELTKEQTLRMRVNENYKFADIVIKNSKDICVIYEKDDEFINVVKSLNYKWNGVCWSRTTDVRYTGTITDRIVELSVKLLQAGINIQLPEPIFIELVKEGKYEIEQRKWVYFNSEVDSFILHVSIDETSYYDEMKKYFKCGKYSSGKFVIPKMYYQTVVDFSLKYNFSLSSGSQKIVNTLTSLEKTSLIGKNIKDNKIDKNIKEETSLEFLKNC